MARYNWEEHKTKKYTRYSYRDTKGKKPERIGIEVYVTNGGHVRLISVNDYGNGHVRETFRWPFVTSDGQLVYTSFSLNTVIDEANRPTKSSRFTLAMWALRAKDHIMDRSITSRLKTIDDYVKAE